MAKAYDYEYEKYKATKENVHEVLDKYGVAIISSLLDENECSAIVSGVWDYLEHISQTWEVPLKRSDENSWREYYKLLPKHSMLLQHWNVGHSQVCWDVRQNPKVVDIFASLWKTKSEDLLVSFDGLSFSLPPEVTKRGYNRNNTWYHSDQSFLRNDFECIQSWVTGLDVNEGDATLSIMEGSHKFHKDLAERFAIKEKNDWFKLEREHEEYLLKVGCSYKYIKCPKGSMVLWDSRTIHCGVEPFRTRETSNSRAVVYVCYQPRATISKVQLKKKQKALEELRTTSHYPLKVKLFSKEPRSYGNQLPVITQINKPVLTDLGRKLAGY